MCVRYVSKSASEVRREQEEAKLAEYEYEDYGGPGSGGIRQCRSCDEESGMPRFFFADTQEEDMNDLPCCQDNSTRPVVRTRRLVKHVFSLMNEMTKSTVG